MVNKNNILAALLKEIDENSSSRLYRLKFGQKDRFSDKGEDTTDKFRTYILSDLLKDEEDQYDNKYSGLLHYDSGQDEEFNVKLATSPIECDFRAPSSLNTRLVNILMQELEENGKVDGVFKIQYKGWKTFQKANTKEFYVEYRTTEEKPEPKTKTEEKVEEKPSKIDKKRGK